jgi:hypothetical protein
VAAIYYASVAGGLATGDRRHEVSLGCGGVFFFFNSLIACNLTGWKSVVEGFGTQVGD